MTGPAARPPQLRILHFVTHLGLGGAEQVVLSLIRELHAGFSFGVFAVRGVERNAIADDMRAGLAELDAPLYRGTSLGLKQGGLLAAGWQAGRAVAAFRPDIVHLHTEIPEAAYAVAATLRPGLKATPLVRTIHNSVYWHYWPRLGRWCERRMPRGEVAAVSIAAQHAFVQHRAASGLPPAAPVVIYNGVATPRTGGPPPRALRRRPRVLFAGRFEAQKGADLIPEIIRTTAASGLPPLELVLHGTGRYEPALRACAAQPPAGWTIDVAPPLPRLAERMHHFDFVIMPSRFEGLGLVAIEAALAGVPVIATRAPGLVEALPPTHPWFAAAGDAADFARVLGLAVTRPAETAASAESARTFARERFDPGTMRDQYAALYRRAAHRE